jgi:hypothetical protein
LPRVVYVLAAGTFMLGTTEFMIAIGHFIAAFSPASR